MADAIAREVFGLPGRYEDVALRGSDGYPVYVELHVVHVRPQGAGELAAGIAHHLNNPVGALASTLRRMSDAVAQLPDDARGELDRQLVRVVELTRRIEAKVGALSAFAEKLEDTPRKDLS